MIDIDCFKQYNDTYGHQAGDNCLRQVSNVIMQSMNRSGDLVARYGGEEIIALLPNTNAGQTLQLAETMRFEVLSLAIPHNKSIAANTDTVSISIGIATLYPNVPLDPKELLKKADEALYQAKANGRNQTVVAAD